MVQCSRTGWCWRAATFPLYPQATRPHTSPAAHAPEGRRPAPRTRRSPFPALLSPRLMADAACTTLVSGGRSYRVSDPGHSRIRGTKSFLQTLNNFLIHFKIVDSNLISI